LTPLGGVPGTVVTVTGTGFAPGQVVKVTWSVATGSFFVVKAGADGRLPARPLYVFSPDLLGMRRAIASAYPRGPLLAEAPFLVQAGSSEPGGLNAGLYFRSESP
jgi:hypothetical protein